MTLEFTTLNWVAVIAATAAGILLARSPTYDREVEIEGLPGGDLIAAGLADLRAGRVTREGLLVAIGSDRLREAGIAVPPWASSQAPEHALYELLSAEDADSAHGRYNAMLRRLVSFERGLDHARGR